MVQVRGKSGDLSVTPAQAPVSRKLISIFAFRKLNFWSEVYGLDAWANLQSITATTNSAYTGCTQESGFTQTVDGNNHLAGFLYDASGNSTKDTIYNMFWNAESQLTYTSGGAAYYYDGDGRRVSKSGRVPRSRKA